MITSDIIAALVAEAWPLSLTPVNVMDGFKCGIYPFNPGEVSDRQLAPSKEATSSHQKKKFCTNEDTKKAMTYPTLGT